jgi:hypothetical protein
MDGWEEEGRTGREEVEVCEQSPRSAGENLSASTSPSKLSTTDTAPFSPSVFSAVPDMVPYPAGVPAKMRDRWSQIR